MPQRLLRKLVWPGLLLAVLLLALTLGPLGLVRNGQQNWLGIGPIVIQPSEVAKLAVILWASHVYANKHRRLGELSHVLIPVVPGMGLVAGLVIMPRALRTALVIFAIMLAMIWVVGAPGTLFELPYSLISIGPFYMSHTKPEA